MLSDEILEIYQTLTVADTATKPTGVLQIRMDQAIYLVRRNLNERHYESRLVSKLAIDLVRKRICSLLGTGLCQ
jgi:hypothetical protein